MVNSCSSPDFRLVTAAAAAMLFALLVMTSSTSVHVLAAKINIKNQCVTSITACDLHAGDRVTCYGLTGGEGKSQVEIDVGAAWSGKIWGLPIDLGDGSLGYQALIQANVAEFSINGGLGLDHYDLSNVNAYNLPMMVKSTSNQTCPSINCTIDNLQSFCQAPNSLTGGPGSGCRNAHGTSALAETNGTRPFSATCPGAISFSEDVNMNKIGSCKTGGNYEVVFCP